MGRGLISGVIWGSLFAIMALWLASQLGGVVALLLPPAEVVSSLPDGGDVAVAVPGQDIPAVPGRQPGPATDPSRQIGALETAGTDVAPRTDTSSGGAPLTAGHAGAPGEPATDRVPDFRDQTGDNPTLPESASAPEPALPTGDAVPSGVGQRPQSVRSPDNGVAPDALALPGDNAQSPQLPASAAADAPSRAGGADQPAQPGADRAMVTDFSTPTVVQTPPAPAPSQTPAPAPGGAGSSTPNAPVSVSPGSRASQPAGSVTAPDATDTPPKVAAIAPNSQPGFASNGALPPVVRGGAVPTKRIGGKRPGVRTNQLPTIGGGGTSAAPDSAPDFAPESAPNSAPGDAILDDPNAPAITRFAEPFENPEGRPLMAVLLLVDPADPLAVTGGAALPFPVTYVVDASQDNANALMRRLRDAGHEVVALTPLPKGASPRDVEVNFQSYLSAVPESVAVMDVRAAMFQGGRAVATQVAQALAATGRGMITYSRGLNSASQVAEREGVPAALVFRVFDSDGRDKATIKRFLDQAAFRAGQQSGVIMVGHDRPETVQALLEWRLGNRAKSVALAPVSAALLAR